MMDPFLMPFINHLFNVISKHEKIASPKSEEEREVRLVLPNSNLPLACRPCPTKSDRSMVCRLGPSEWNLLSKPMKQFQGLVFKPHHSIVGLYIDLGCLGCDSSSSLFYIFAYFGDE